MKKNILLILLLKAGAKPDKKTYKLVNKSKDVYIKDLFTEYGCENEK